MARDEEIRKVAEDIRALARSLARDFREAVDQSRAGGQRPGEAVRHGLKGVAEEAKRGVKDTWSDLGPFSGSCGPGKYWQREWARHNRYRSRYANRYWVPPAPSAGFPGSPPGEPVGGPEAGGGDARFGGPGFSPAPTAPTWTRHPHRRSRPSGGLPPVRRRWDGSTVLGMLAVLFGVAWLLSAVHAIHVSVEGVVAVGLMLLGAAMIVTGRTDWSLSRRMWPVWLGVGLVAILVATSATFGTRGVSFGTKSVPVVHSGQNISGGFGNLTVDASHFAGTGEITVTNIAGVVRVRVPPGSATVVNAKVLAGEICAGGLHRADGVQASAEGLRLPPAAPATGIDAPPVLTVNVHESTGQIIVGGSGCSR